MYHLVFVAFEGVRERVPASGRAPPAPWRPGPVGPGVACPVIFLVFYFAIPRAGHGGTTRPRIGLINGPKRSGGQIISQGPGARQVAHKMEEPRRMWPGL